MQKQKKALGRPRKKPNEKLTHVFMVRFDEDFYQKFRKFCDDECIMVSSFIRKAVDTELKKRGVI